MLAIVFDTETTGLTLHPDAPVHKQPRMIEFGAVIIDTTTYQEVEAISLLINPGEHITDEITKITGLSDADVKDAPSFEQALPQIAEAFAKCSSVWAHNLPFDRAIINGELARIDDHDPFPWPEKGICTVGLYKEAWGRNPRLIELYESVTGKKYEQTHRALDDVRALVEIIVAEQLFEVV